MKTNNYEYFRVAFTDGTEDIVIGTSPEEIKAEQEALYGPGSVDKVMTITGEELASTDPTDPVKNHQANVSILTGRNPYASELGEERTLKTMASRYVTNRKNYKAAHNELKTKGGNVHDVARKYQGVDTKELQSMGEENNPIMEGEDKLMYLARIGLMQKNEVLLLKRALQQKRSGHPMSVKNRDLLFKLMEKLISMITGNGHMWNLARRKVVEDVINEFDDRFVSEQWIQMDDWLMEAGYCDAPKTKAELNKRRPNIKTDVKNKNSRDLQPVRFK